MDKTALVERFAPEEMKPAFAHILDLWLRSGNRNICTAGRFLSEADAAQAENMLRAAGAKDFFFFGGYEGAERKCPVFLPDYYTEETVTGEPSLCGITYIVAEVNRFDAAEADFSHRDCLGSLMALGIERDAVGDLITDGGKAVMIVRSEIAGFLLQSLTGIGRYPVRVRQEEILTIERKEDFTVVSDTVAAMRLDAVTASVFHLSRGAAADAIGHGLVAVNGITAGKPDRTVGEGDRISLRGKGRIQIERIEGESKKGRIRYLYKRFR